MADDDEIDFGHLHEDSPTYGKKPRRQFKGVWIPKAIWDDSQLTDGDKCLLAEVDALDDGVQGCFASNEYLAGKLNCSASAIASRLTRLRKQNYIATVKFDGRKRWICVPLMRGQTSQIDNADFAKTGGQTSQIDTIDNRVENKRESTLARANEIWSAFPRKIAKPAGMEAIKRALKRESFEHLLAKTKAFAAVWRDAPEEEHRFIPYPQKWFNQERYNDPPSEWRPKAQRKGIEAAPINVRNKRINELNRRKQELIRANAPYWKIHEIDMQLRKL